ncbi:MAG: DUF4270 domain-containing protein [Flavobacteriaceae bacterium]
MNKIKSILSVFLFGGLMVSCNSDADDLGKNLFDGNSVTGNQVSYDLVTYNINNGDVVRADSYALQRATLGAFTEGQFGMQKSAYVTQVRLSKYAPDFGTNPVVDSVVLEIKPQYDATTKAVTTTNVTHEGQAAKQTLTKYEAIKYGNPAATMNIDVHEIATDLGAVGMEKLSNSPVATSGLPLGTKVFSGNVYAVSINKTSDNTALLTKDTGLRIQLDKNYFKTKITDKNGAAELSNESNFINYFKGLKISVRENDGYLINFAPNEVTMTMYYRSGGKSNTFSFDLGSSNVHFSQISYNRSSTFNTVMAGINSTNGDPLLYMQGMGGPGAGIKLNGAGVSDLKRLYKERGAAILSAKVRLYTDTNTWNNSYTKPVGFLVRKQGETDFITDLKTMLGNSNYSLVKAYSTNSNPSYYDIDITKTIKDIVEKEAEAKDLIVNIGEYLISNGNLVSEDYNNNVSSPYRAVFVGTNAANNNRPKLMVTYVTK